MTTLENRPRTALLVVAVQNGVVAGNHDRGLTRDSEGWQMVPELSPNAAEPRVDKSYGDSFEDTNLESVLAGLAVGRLVVAGAQTDMCIRSTLHGALARGYDALLVSD